MNTPQLRFSHAVRRIGVRRPGAYHTGRARPWTARDPAPRKVSVWEWPFGAYQGQRAEMLELEDAEAGDNVQSVVASSGLGVSGVEVLVRLAIASPALDDAGVGDLSTHSEGCAFR